MSHIFISYSRKDLDTAARIVQALAANQLDTWIDWKSIPKGEDWEHEIHQGIEAADAFLFLISEDSVASEMCNREIAHAVTNGKRILPIFVTNVDNQHVYSVTRQFVGQRQQEEINRRNFIFCRKEFDDFNQAIAEIKQTIQTDYEWLKYHTELQVKALKWEQKKDNSRLLRGKELREAEEQLAGTGTSRDPQPTELHRTYVLASQRNEERQRRQAIIGLGVGLAVLAGLAIFAWLQRNTAVAETNSRATAESNAISESNAKATALVNEQDARATAQAEKDRAEEQAQIALARQLAAQAQALIISGSSKQDLASLLALQSMKINFSLEASQVLLNSKLARPSIVFWHKAAVNDIALSADNNYIVSGSDDGTARVWSVRVLREISHMSHGDPVSKVAFSPSQLMVASGSNDGTILIWDALAGTLISELHHAAAIRDLEFSPDGKWLISAGDDNTARVWEVQSGTEISRITHEQGVSAIAVSPDGKWAVSVGEDGADKVWDPATGKEISIQIHENNPSRAVAISPNSRLVATSNQYSGGISVWEALSGETTGSFFMQGGTITDMAFSPDGQMLAVCANDLIQVWDLTGHHEIARMKYDTTVTSVGFSADGLRIFAGSADKTGRVWSIIPPQELVVIKLKASVNEVIMSSDGRLVVSAAEDGGIAVWNASPGILSTMDQWGPVWSLDFSPNGKRVATGAWVDTIWDLQKNQEISWLNKDLGRLTFSIKFSPNGRLIASGSGDDTVRIWDATSGKIIHELMHGNTVNSVQFSPDGNLVASGSNDNKARVWEISTGIELSSVTHQSRVISVAFSPDGEYVISGSSDGAALVWAVKTGDIVSQAEFDGAVNSVAFSPDTQWAVASGREVIKIWKVLTGEEVISLQQDGTICCIDISPDGNLIVSGSTDHSVRIWNASSGAELQKWFHDDTVTAVAFSPNGQWVASASTDNTVRVWEISTGQEVARKFHLGEALAVSFSPNGDLLASGGRDRTTQIWFWKPADLIDQTCSFLTRNLTFAEWQQYIGDVLPYRAVCPNLPIEPDVILTPTP